MMRRPTTRFGWACAVAVLAATLLGFIALLVVIAQMTAVVDMAGVPEEVAAAGDEYRAREGTAILLGVVLLGLGLLTAMVPRLRPAAASRGA